MGKALSLELRERAMARLVAGESERAVASALDVAPSSVVKWSQRLRETGSCAPAGTGGHPPRKIVGAHEAWLLDRIRPASTLRGLVLELAERGLKVDYRTVWAFVHRTGYSFKKDPVRGRAEPPRCEPTPRALETVSGSHRPTSARIHPLSGHCAAMPCRAVGETWAKTNMAPLRGWAPKGERLIGWAPHGHWRTMTVIAALRNDRIDAPLVLDGPVNGEAFRAYVEHVLVPTLHPGDGVVMDNLRSHKGQAVRQAIRNAQAHLLFLTP